VEDGSTSCSILRPNLSPVAADNCPGNRQSKAGAVLLCRDEWLKNARLLLQQNQDAPLAGQRCPSLSRRSAGREHCVTRHPRRASSPLCADLGFRHTQPHEEEKGLSMPSLKFGALAFNNVHAEADEADSGRVASKSSCAWH
jgi:hypothetical protein